MINAKLTVSPDQILTITVDLKEDHGPSKSGKTIIIASSQGNKPVQQTGAIVGLNIYRKR